MENLKENKNCYATPEQREVMLHMLTHPAVEQNFFLTGGTALSVFYLNHRKSNDIDMFSIGSPDLSGIDFVLKRMWAKDYLMIRKSQDFLSVLIKDVKVEFVIDPLSITEKRPKILFENNHYLQLDTINNIVSNKLCTLVSRTEPKDFIDFYFILKEMPPYSIESVYRNAGLKDAIFEDLPTVAFQIENNLEFLKKKPELFPEMLLHFDQKNLLRFYEDIVNWIYQQAKR